MNYLISFSKGLVYFCLGVIATSAVFYGAVTNSPSFVFAQSANQTLITSTEKLPGHVSPLPEINYFQVTSYHITGQSGLRYEFHPIQMDLNGDGLQDLIFRRRNHTNGNIEEYIYTNTGGSFKRTYYCNEYISGTEYYYRGDCADPDYAI